MTPSPLNNLKPLALSVCAGKEEDCSQCKGEDGFSGRSQIVLPRVVVGFDPSVRVDDPQTTEANDKLNKINLSPLVERL